MTRINGYIPVESLTDEHLLAEHREIKRITSNFIKRVQMNKFDDIPSKFTLGTGHVLFFIDKGRYTYNRYIQLFEECKARNFLVTNYADNWDVYKNYPAYFKDYVASDNDINVLKERISTRLKSSKIQWHYKRLPIETQSAIELLN